MKILCLAHTFPYPLNDGVRLHVYYILKELSKRHAIYLLCLNDQPVSDEEKKAVEKIGVKIVQILTHRVPQNFFLRLWNTFLDSVPFCVRQFESESIRQSLRNFLAKEKVDLVHVDYISMAVYRNEFATLPSVFFPHDAVSMLFERNVKSETNFFRKTYTYFQWKKVKNFETRWIPNFQGTMVVSPVDREYLLKHCPGQKIAVSPNGVDTDYFAPSSLPEEENSVLFRGVMNFLPNSDAVRFFYQDVLPLIRKQIPSTKFYVVGKYPPPDLIEWAKNDPLLVITDYVEDMREWMGKAGVIVCPMRIGSGIKNKILESMAMAKAIVSTPMACAGLQINDGEHLFMAENPSELAEKSVTLLKNASLRKQMGGKAREFVKDYYTWKRNADDFEKLYLEAVKEFKA